MDYEDTSVLAADIAGHYRTVRRQTDMLTAALSAEDQTIQSMPDASPAKWHRAHTSWFFEEFVLGPHQPGYDAYDPDIRFLFNSYYEAVGARHPRPARGMITRPSADQVTRYRAHIDAAMLDLIDQGSAPAELVRLGLNHEQQHQELLVTDMMHAFAQSPLYPAVLPGWVEPVGDTSPANFVRGQGGIVRIGHTGDGFAFDCETPRHDALLAPFRIADRVVRNSDWLDFMQDGGYRTVGLWMSDGWACAQAGGWDSPMYWRDRDDGWWQMGPGGLFPLNPDAPVRHVSWYEADAFARWAGARLPTEFELEYALRENLLHDGFGHVWQWSNSAYLPYPGFVPEAGAIGEYNGKFMINQMVLRGGSFATPDGHSRPGYRNFFPPDKRWQVTGLRLAKDDPNA